MRYRFVPNQLPASVQRPKRSGERCALARKYPPPGCGTRACRPASSTRCRVGSIMDWHTSRFGAISTTSLEPLVYGFPPRREYNPPAKPKLCWFPHRTSATRWQTLARSEPRLNKRQPQLLPNQSPLSANLSCTDKPAGDQGCSSPSDAYVFQHPSGAQGHRLPRAFVHVFSPPTEGLFTHNSGRKLFVSSALCHRLSSSARSRKVAGTIKRGYPLWL